MTFEQRERIFSKDYISLSEFMEITGYCRSTASGKMKAIRRKYNRLNTLGRIHTQDYFDYFNLNPNDYRAPVLAESVQVLASAIAAEVISKIGEKAK